MILHMAFLSIIRKMEIKRNGKNVRRCKTSESWIEVVQSLNGNEQTNARLRVARRQSSRIKSKEARDRESTFYFLTALINLAEPKVKKSKTSCGQELREKKKELWHRSDLPALQRYGVDTHKSSRKQAMRPPN